MVVTRMQYLRFRGVSLTTSSWRRASNRFLIRRATLVNWRAAAPPTALELLWGLSHFPGLLPYCRSVLATKPTRGWNQRKPKGRTRYSVYKYHPRNARLGALHPFHHFEQRLALLLFKERWGRIQCAEWLTWKASAIQSHLRQSIHYCFEAPTQGFMVH